MSYVPSNLTTALIRDQQTDVTHKEHFLLKVAFTYAQKGLNVCILNNLKIDFEEEEYLLDPEILQRINFRYWKTFEEVIRWCHEIHNLEKKPSLVLIPLQGLLKSKKFEIYSLFGALVDALIYLSNCEKSKQFNLLATVPFGIYDYPDYIHQFFNCTWTCTKVKSFITSFHLKPYSKHYDKTMDFEIIIDSNSQFDELKKIFEERPKFISNKHKEFKNLL